MKNEYGLDLDYFKKLIKRELGDISRFKPDEFARVCLRMSVTAESSVINEPEFSKLTDLQKQNDELRAKVAKYESVLCQTCHGAGTVLAGIDDGRDCPECAQSLADIRAEAVMEFTEHVKYTFEGIMSDDALIDFGNEYIANRIKEG